MEFRLQKAKEFGANLVYKVDVKDDEETTTKKILEVFGEEPTTTFECSGVQSSARTAILVRSFQIKKLMFKYFDFRLL